MKVLITGAQGALGQAVVKRFFEAGHQVTGTCSKASPTSDLPVRWIPVDLSNSNSVRNAFSENSDFDILIHCAGGFRYALADSFQDEDLDFLINVNLKSAFYLVREILPGMKKRNFGRILFVSSKSAQNPPGGLGLYAASKAGLNSLTLALAEETKSFQITVNAVLPTVIDTPANRKDMPHAKFQDWVTSEQLAEILFMLTEPKGAPIHGALLPVAGRV